MDKSSDTQTNTDTLSMDEKSSLDVNKMLHVITLKHTHTHLTKLPRDRRPRTL